jgi:hypothetical protein
VDKTAKCLVTKSSLLIEPDCPSDSLIHSASHHACLDGLTRQAELLTMVVTGSRSIQQRYCQEHGLWVTAPPPLSIIKADPG